MMFSSRTPRDLNRDPLPWWHDHEELCDVNRLSGSHLPRSATKETLDDRFDPRPEYDAVQHNEPNPILVEFRQSGDPEFPDNWLVALSMMHAFGGMKDWEDPRSYFHPLTKATASHIDHAYKVLSRLAALAENG